MDKAARQAAKEERAAARQERAAAREERKADREQRKEEILQKVADARQRAGLPASSTPEELEARREEAKAKIEAAKAKAEQIRAEALARRTVGGVKPAPSVRLSAAPALATPPPPAPPSGHGYDSPDTLSAVQGPSAAGYDSLDSVSPTGHAVGPTASGYDAPDSIGDAEDGPGGYDSLDITPESGAGHGYAALDGVQDAADGVEALETASVKYSLPTIGADSKTAVSVAVEPAPLSAAADVDPTDWNERYQQLVEAEQAWLERHGSQAPARPVDSEAQGQTTAQLAAMRRLTLEFCAAARATVEVLINEKSLPNDLKSVKAIDAGGVAGGQKFIHRNIFFKFVADFQGIYGGDYFAQKAAGAELRGLRAYREANVRGLHTGIMAVIDFAGYRVIAASKLPLAKGSLVYGSADAGETVFAEDPSMNALMKEAARRINIKGHFVGRTNKKLLFAAVDIEGHIDSTPLRRKYVLDTARVFPPEQPCRVLAASLLPCDGTGATLLELPTAGWRDLVRQYVGVSTASDEERASWRVRSVQVEEKGLQLIFAESPTASWPVNSRAVALALPYAPASAPPAVPTIRGDVVVVGAVEKARHLVNLLRPELVRSYPSPLSSDAFSWFGIDQHLVHNAEVQKATETLRSRRIAEFAKHLARFEISAVTGERLTQLLHQHGINVRYLGRVFFELETLRSATGIGVSQGADQSRVALEQSQAVVLTEMIARVAKLQLRTLLRLAQEAHCADPSLPINRGAPSSESAAQLVQSLRRVRADVLVRFLNLLFGSSAASRAFWCTELKIALMLKFGCYGELFGFFNELHHPDADLRPRIRKSQLLLSLVRSCGVSVAPAVLARFLATPDTFTDGSPQSSLEAPFTPSSLVNAGLQCVDSLLELTDAAVANSLMQLSERAVSEARALVSAAAPSSPDFPLSPRSRQALSPDMAAVVLAYEQWSAFTGMTHDVFGDLSCVRAAGVLKLSSCLLTVASAAASESSGAGAMKQQALLQVFDAAALLFAPRFATVIPTEIAVCIHFQVGSTLVALGDWARAGDHFYFALALLIRDWGYGQMLYLTSDEDIFISGSGAAHRRVTTGVAEATARAAQLRQAASKVTADARAQYGRSKDPAHKKLIEEARVRAAAMNAEAKSLPKKASRAAMHHSGLTRTHVIKLHPLSTVVVDALVQCLYRSGQHRQAEIACTLMSPFELKVPTPPDAEAVRSSFVSPMPANAPLSFVPTPSAYPPNVPIIPFSLLMRGSAEHGARVSASRTILEDPAGHAHKAWARAYPKPDLAEQSRAAFLAQVREFRRAPESIVSAPFDGLLTEPPARIVADQKTPPRQWVEAETNLARSHLSSLMRGVRGECLQFFSSPSNTNYTRPEATTAPLLNALNAKYGAKQPWLSRYV